MCSVYGEVLGKLSKYLLFQRWKRLFPTISAVKKSNLYPVALFFLSSFCLDIKCRYVPTKGFQT